MRVYLDSNILVYLLEGTPEFSDPIAAAMREIPEAHFCISDLVRLECLVDPIRKYDTERKAAFDAQFETLTVLQLESAAFDTAAELRARERLKTPDAIHVATALHHGCVEFWTNDHRLSPVARRIRLRILP